MPSIIVPARNNGEFTATCLASILYSVSRLKLNCEFILIDDASGPEDRMIDVFREHRAKAVGHETKIIRSRKWQHYSGVFSIGLHHSTRDLIFFISNDMMVSPSFIQALLLVSSLSREFGIVRGTSNYVDSHPEHTVVPPEKPRNFQEVDAFSRSIFGANACSYVEDQSLSGDAILVKRSLVERIGVLDLRFFGYFGDPDYGMRAQLAGFKLVCAKGAWLMHEGSGHVKHEMARNSHSFEEARDRRMALVQAGYREFRKKWAFEQPETWNPSGTPATFFSELARSRPGQVDIKYDFPPSALNDLEIY